MVTQIDKGAAIRAASPFLNQTAASSVKSGIPPMAAVAPEICLKQVMFGYDGEPLFNDFNFTVTAGQWTCLLGPSGCGKSTLLQLISGGLQMKSGGLNREVSGQIQFDGQSRQQGQIAWMAQKDLLLPWLSVMENVLLGARLRNRLGRDLRQQALGLLQEVGLGDHGHAYPDSLSGGMRQRVALLRTFMERRPVILMDEPFSALDALTRLKLQSLAAQMLQGSTVLLVTHDPWEALRLGHRIVIMRERPVRLSRVFMPPGNPPRPSGHEKSAAMYQQLLAQLVEKEA